MLSPRRLARHAWQTGLNLLMPPRCVLCERELDADAQVQLCPGCVAALSDEGLACRRCGMAVPHLATGGCAHCRKRKFQFHRVFRFGEYSGLLRDAVLQAKTITGEPIAAALGDLLASAVVAQLDDGFEGPGPSKRFDLVACVPSFWARRLRRGTNSAAVLAQVLARRLRVPAGLDLLVCRRNIEKQSQLSLAERQRNVRGAYRKSWGYDIRGASLLLVDDVMTSGATAHEIARVLRGAGAQRVAVAVAARALGPDW